MTIHLTHLQRLEAEAIHIFREVAANFANPVMLYSVGKDSSVLLHLAMKAFFPAKPPFPFLHVDTTWKFREMIAFRDQMAAKLGFDLLVHTNEDGVRAEHQPVRPRLQHLHPHHEDGGAAPGARQIRLRRGLRRRPPRRGEVARQGAHLLLPQRAAQLGPQAPAAGDVEDLQHPRRAGRIDPRLPAVQLDRARYLAVHPAGGHPDRAALFRQAAAGRRARRHADHGR